MKMELIDKVMQRMIGVINESQLQELRMALVMALEGVTVQRWLITGSTSGSSCRHF